MHSTKINFVGDVSLFLKYEIDNIDPFLSIELPFSDYNVANFEFPLSKRREKNFYDVSDEYLVSYDFAKKLDLSKFDLYGLANNHIYDYGIEGIRTTQKLMTDKRISYFGITNNSEYHVFKKIINNISFAFIALVKDGRWRRNTDTEIGPNIICPVKLVALVKDLNKNHNLDHIIVFLHWGTELVDAPMPEDVKLARSLIDSGASCVIGHHPHVCQGVESYNNGLIAYSLGSFIYLSEFEKGNFDNSRLRDLSECISIEFDKESIKNFVTYKYQRHQNEYHPRLISEFSDDPYFRHLNKVIDDKEYYTRQVRNTLLKRELFSFLVRFKEDPFKTIWNYSKYIRVYHLKKILGLRDV